MTSPACISSIFSRSEFREEEVVVINAFPGRLDMRRPMPVDRPAPPKRGLITGFSKKSRLNFMKMMAELELMPNIWQDFTFPDDVMDGLTVEERHKKAAKCVKDFKRELEKEYPDSWGFWKKEAETRKSGSLKGEEIPHYHNLMFLPGVSQGDHDRHCRRIARIWLRVIGTQDPNAEKVAVNGKSFRWLNDAKHAMVYVSKYVAKPQNFDDGVSRGRFWGVIGKLPLSDGIEMTLTHNEWHLLKRSLRRLAKRNKRMFRKMQKRFVNGFFFVGLPTVLKLLEYVQSSTAPPF